MGLDESLDALRKVRAGADTSALGASASALDVAAVRGHALREGDRVLDSVSLEEGNVIACSFVNVQVQAT